jgi:DNA-binding IclR family transcriptional regulator
MELAMNSPDRMLAILDLFEGSSLEWTIEAMGERLGYTRSTLYRYLKSLTDAGLLASLPGIGYTLGPRIAELDYSMRCRDPVIVAGAPLMAELVTEIPSVALLCRRYRDRVLCVHQAHNGVDFVSNYERGRARSLIRGAASRIILANLPAPLMRKTLETHAGELAAAGLGETIAAARAVLREIRAKGWDSTAGDVTPGVVGIAAPVFDQSGAVLGSLSLTMANSPGVRGQITEIAKRIIFCAKVLNRAAARREEQRIQSFEIP